MSEAVAVRVKSLSRIFCVLVAVLVFLSDQVTKAMVESSIPEHAVIPILPHCFNLTHIKNAGAAFGLFSNAVAPWKTALLIVVSAALLLIVAGIVWRSCQLDWPAGVGLALILGGALSNLVDRLRLGRVVDFLDFYLRSYHWPSFNLADSAIVVGAGLLILHIVFTE